MFALVLLFAASPAWSKANDKALRLYAKGDMAKAAAAFKKALPLAKGDHASEVETRKYVVLSLLGANQREAAINDYRALLEVEPGFAWNADEILPEELAYLDAALGKKAPTPTPTPAPTPAPAPASQEKPVVVEKQIDAAPEPIAPREIQVTSAPVPAKKEKAWHWYYLAPLGIGQYLAGSPVRGTLLLVLELAAVAANVTGFVLYNRELLPNGTARSKPAAEVGQTLMNVGFFSLLGTVVLGALDGALLEP